MEGDEKITATETQSTAPETKSWTCPQCGNENDGNFCFRCGSARPKPRMNEDASATPIVESWTCPQCGNENDGNFCFRCGGTRPEPLATDAPKSTFEPPAADAPESAFEPPAADAPEPTPEPSVSGATTPGFEFSSADVSKASTATTSAMPELPDTPAAPKRKVKPWVWAIAAAVVLIAIGFGAFTANQSKAYDEALEAFSSGNYSQAAEEFQKLGNYKDAAAMYDKSTKWIEAQKAEAAAENSHTVKSWRTAAEAYEALDDDAAKQKIAWCYENVDYWTAMDMIEQKPTDRDTVTEALALFEKCNDIDYISDRIAYCNDVLDYYKAGDLYAQGHYYDAYELYNRIGINAATKLGDVESKRDSCIQSSPGNGVVYRNDSYPSDSCELTIVNEGNPNAYYKLYIGDDLVVTVFINAGESATFMLPAGEYNMNKAYGDSWFGPDDMFGDEGSYFVCSFGGSTSVELEANNGYEISSGGEGTGIGTRSADRNSI